MDARHKAGHDEERHKITPCISFASKALAFFSLPTNVLLCLALVGLVLIGLRRPIGKTLTIAAAAAIGFAGLSPLGNMLLTPLEQRFAGMQFPDGQIDGIIVLGGSYDRIRGYLNTVILEDSTHAMAAVPGLARRYPEAKIIFSGGTAEENVHVPPEAIVARQLFISFGISPDRIIIEDQSRNTVENARLTAHDRHAQARPALAAGDQCLPHAARHGHVPAGRIRRHRLPCRMAHQWLARLFLAAAVSHRGPAPGRRGHARMDRADCVQILGYSNVLFPV